MGIKLEIIANNKTELNVCLMDINKLKPFIKDMKVSDSGYFGSDGCGAYWGISEFGD